VAGMTCFMIGNIMAGERIGRPPIIIFTVGFHNNSTLELERSSSSLSRDGAIERDPTILNLKNFIVVQFRIDMKFSVSDALLSIIFATRGQMT